jgi:hypothetical protein
MPDPARAKESDRPPIIRDFDWVLGARPVRSSNRLSPRPGREKPGRPRAARNAADASRSRHPMRENADVDGTG